jgi:Flp pilus assembly protein TadG
MRPPFILQPRKLRTIRTDEDGVGAVEFAVIAPLLIAILMGTLEFGCIFYTYLSAQLATGDVNRQLASNHIQASQNSTVAQQVQQAIVARLPKWAQGQANAVPTQSTTSPALWTITTTVPMKAATPTNFFSAVYGSRNITTKGIMQQEPTS